MKKLIQKNCYYYEFKGHFYFRKRLSKNVIKNASKDMIFRKSILKICSDYKTIKNKKDIIINLTKYLKEAIIEYSELEDLRNNDLTTLIKTKNTKLF